MYSEFILLLCWSVPPAPEHLCSFVRTVWLFCLLHPPLGELVASWLQSLTSGKVWDGKAAPSAFLQQLQRSGALATMCRGGGAQGTPQP